MQFGKYKVINKLSTGGMASIHEAVSKDGDRIVVKSILDKYSKNERFIKMFLDEAKVSLLLDHPNIVKVIDVGRNLNGDYYIAMEYLPGKNLWDIFIEARKHIHSIPIDIACAVTIFILRGLAYAHNKKDQFGKPLSIVHRDISPPNIFISFKGDVKILDFGIAQIRFHFNIDEDEYDDLLKGKFSYMSPEQAKGTDLDLRSDLFSIGILLYEMLTLKKLFSYKTHDEAVKLISKFKLPKIKEINNTIPKDLEKILLKALAKDRKKRYQSAVEFEKDLEMFMKGASYLLDTKKTGELVKKIFNIE